MTKFPFVGEAWWVKETQELSNGTFKVILTTGTQEPSGEILGVFVANEEGSVEELEDTVNELMNDVNNEVMDNLSELARQIIIDWCHWKGNPAAPMDYPGDKYLVELFKKNNLIYVPKEGKVPGEPKGLQAKDLEEIKSSSERQRAARKAAKRSTKRDLYE